MVAVRVSLIQDLKGWLIAGTRQRMRRVPRPAPAIHTDSGTTRWLSWQRHNGEPTVECVPEKAFTAIYAGMHTSGFTISPIYFAPQPDHGRSPIESGKRIQPPELIHRCNKGGETITNQKYTLTNLLGMANRDLLVYGLRLV